MYKVLFRIIHTANLKNSRFNGQSIFIITFIFHCEFFQPGYTSTRHKVTVHCSYQFISLMKRKHRSTVNTFFNSPNNNKGKFVQVRKIEKAINFLHSHDNFIAFYNIYIFRYKHRITLFQLTFTTYYSTEIIFQAC